MTKKSQNNNSNIVINIWKDLFDSFNELLAIVSKEEKEMVIEMFIEDRINPELFINNLRALLGITTLSIEEQLLGIEDKTETTKSISNFIAIFERPPLPLWFIASYPDVIDWFNKQGSHNSKLYNQDYEGWEKEAAKIMGLNINNEEIDKKKGRISLQAYKNLICGYKKNAKKQLEVSIEAGSADDIYLGAELLDDIRAESNFTLIAENTTKFYLELNKNYQDRFNNTISLLAVAGILDAQFYVFVEQTINPLEILNIAEKAVSSEKEIILDFIVNLEIKLFQIDTPEVDILTIERACIEQEGAILKTIEKTKNTYHGEKSVALFVKKFMNEKGFEPYRTMIGVKNNNH